MSVRLPSEPGKKRAWIKYAVAFLIGAVMSVLILWSRGAFAAPLTAQELDLHLSDAFFITGVLIFCAGALVFVSRNGAFDIFTYSVKYVLSFMRKKQPGEKRENYYDYKERLAAKDKTPCLFLIITGLVFLMAGAVFALMFMGEPV